MREAREETSPRSQAAGFAAIIGKPFDVDELVEAVGHAVGAAVPFDHSATADTTRTQALVERLEAARASDVRGSPRREWVTFRSEGGTLVQLYWWQQGGVYYCGQYAADGSTMRPIGQFYDLDAAIAAGLSARTEP